MPKLKLRKENFFTLFFLQQKNIGVLNNIFKVIKLLQ
jgi:hypothetical protein